MKPCAAGNELRNNMICMVIELEVKDSHNAEGWLG